MTAARKSAAPAACNAPHVLAELKLADRIISAMLNAMTIQQKAKVHTQLEAAGITGAGMTRANERLAVIDAAAMVAQPADTAPTDQAAGLRKSDIEARACDIGAQALDASILLQAIFEKLDGLRDIAAGPMSSVVSAINCFATCTARNAALIAEAADDIVSLVREGGAA